MVPFEIAACGGGRSGNCLRQMSPVAPINWDGTSDPYTIMGDLSWTDYTVSSDALLEQAGYEEFMGRVGTQAGFSPANINAYYLRLTSSGAWSILKNTTGGTVTTLASGTVTAPGINTWHNLALGFQGSTIICPDRSCSGWNRNRYFIYRWSGWPGCKRLAECSVR